MELKDKAAQWLKSNGSILVAVIGLVLIAINNSWLGLTMYTVVIHALGLFYIVGLYDKNYLSMEQVRAIAKQSKSKSKLEKRKGLIILYTLCASSIIILVARDHWYLLIVTLVTIICVTIHVIDALQKLKKERRATSSG